MGYKKSNFRLLNLIILALYLACFCIPSAFAGEEGEGITQGYRKALDLNPNDMDARYLLGVSLLREKAYREAISHLLTVYPSRSGDADMNYNIGLAYAGMGELQKASQHYVKVEEINASEARDKYRLDVAFYNIGVGYQKEGKLDEAVKAYQEAVRINPEQPNAHCAKGEIFYQKKDYDKALESLTTCKQKDPERKSVNRYISAIYQERGVDQLNRKNYAEARTEIEKAVSSDSTNEAAYYYMGYLEYLAGNYNKAISALERVKKSEREDMKKSLGNLFYNIGAAMQKKEDWQGAVSAFNQAIDINSADPELRFFLGYSYMKTKEPDLAMAAFKEALRLNPKHQGASLNLVVVSEAALRAHLDNGSDLLKKGSFKEALKEFSLALSIDPNNHRAKESIKKVEEESAERTRKEIAANLSKGNKFMTEGRYLEAKRSFEAVLALYPEHLTAQEELKKSVDLLKTAEEKHRTAGESAFAEGRYYKASIEYKKATGLDLNDKELAERLEESLKRLFEQVTPVIKAAQEHERGGRLPEAMAAYERVIEMQPDHKSALEGKHRVSENIEKVFDEALSNGRNYARAGELQKAAEGYRIALELKPANDMVLSELKAISGRLQKVLSERLANAASALRAGRYGEAISNYKTVLIIDRENKDAAAGLQSATRLRNEALEKKLAAGIRAYKDDNYSQAIAAFGEVLQIDPGNAEAQKMQREAKAKIDESITPWLKAGAEAYKKGDMDAAVVSFKKVLNVDPGNREAKEYLGKMDVQRTKASLAKEVEKYYLGGIELYTNGKYREAMESWKKVLELDPKHEKALLNIEKAKRKMEGVMDTK